MSEPIIIHWLSICDRIRDEAGSRGYMALTPIERAVCLSERFNCEQEMGSLSQFFYNSDCSAAFTEATILALRAIGAPRTAEVVAQTAALFTQSRDGSLGSTWGEYLSAVDPQNRLDDFDSQLPISGEDIFSLMEAFIIQHRHELAPPSG